MVHVGLEEITGGVPLPVWGGLLGGDHGLESFPERTVTGVDVDKPVIPLDRGFVAIAGLVIPWVDVGDFATGDARDTGEIHSDLNKGVFHE